MFAVQGLYNGVSACVSKAREVVYRHRKVCILTGATLVSLGTLGCIQTALNPRSSGGVRPISDAEGLAMNCLHYGSCSIDAFTSIMMHRGYSGEQLRGFWKKVSWLKQLPPNIVLLRRLYTGGIKKAVDACLREESCQKRVCKVLWETILTAVADDAISGESVFGSFDACSRLCGNFTNFMETSD